MTAPTGTDLPTGLDVTRLSGSLGAEVRGLALARATADDAARHPPAAPRPHGAVLPRPAPHPRRAHRLRPALRDARVAPQPDVRVRTTRVLRAARRGRRGRRGRRVAQRHHLRGPPVPLRHPPHEGVPRCRRRHDVGQCRQGLRRAVAPAAGAVRRPDRAARRRPPPRTRQDPHPPGGAGPSRDRPAVAVRQRALHPPHRRAERRRVDHAARPPVPLDPRAPVHRAVPLGGRHGRHVGQPLHPAPRPERLRGRPHDPAGHGHGRRARGRRARHAGRPTAPRPPRSGATPPCASSSRPSGADRRRRRHRRRRRAFSPDAIGCTIAP